MEQDLYMFLPIVLISVFQRSVLFQGSEEWFGFDLSNTSIFLLILFSEIAELLKLESLQKEFSLRQSSGMENFSLNRLGLVEIEETEAWLFDRGASVNSRGGGACGGVLGATTQRENTIQLLSTAFTLSSYPNLCVLSKAMPKSVSVAQKYLLRHTTNMPVRQLLRSMGYVIGLKIKIKPSWESVGDECDECASVQPGWSCVGVSFATRDIAIISGPRNNRGHRQEQHVGKKLFILGLEVEGKWVAFKLTYWP